MIASTKRKSNSANKLIQDKDQLNLNISDFSANNNLNKKVKFDGNKEDKENKNEKFDGSEKIITSNI